MAESSLVGLVLVLLGSLLSLSIFYGGYYYVPEGVIPLPRDDDVSTRLFYTLRCFLAPATVLWAMISKVGLDRGKVGALNPLAGREHLMLLGKKRLINTLEQMTIFALQALCLTFLLEREEMKVIFLYSLIFVLGRIFFWVGYGIDPAYRGLGTFMTFMSCGVVQGIAAYVVSSHYFLFGHWAALSSSVSVPIFVLILLPHVL